MPKLIIGLVGQAGAGKGTAANMLRDSHKAETFTFSAILTDILKRLFLDNSRDNLIKISMSLRDAFGQDVLSNAMEKQVANSKAEIVTVDGIRRMDDIQDLSKAEGFHLIEITAPAEVRFDRLKNRNEKIGEGSMTWDEFLETSKKETERTIAGVAEKAELHIDNSGSMEELEQKLQKMITSLS